MRLLLDSTAVLAVLFTPEMATRRTTAAITDATNEVWVSAISPFELEWKKKIGKLDFPVIDSWETALSSHRYKLMHVTTAQGVMAARLPIHHRDPWDRVIIAQALADGMTIVTNDRMFAAYGVPVLW